MCYTTDDTIRGLVEFLGEIEGKTYCSWPPVLP